MFFNKRKILKNKYEDTKNARESLESFIKEKSKNGSIPNGKWLEYVFIEHLHALSHSGEFNTIKSKLELEERKLLFLIHEFQNEFKEFNKILTREKNINQILEE